MPLSLASATSILATVTSAPHLRTCARSTLLFKTLVIEHWLLHLGQQADTQEQKISERQECPLVLPAAGMIRFTTEGRHNLPKQYVPKLCETTNMALHMSISAKRSKRGERVQVDSMSSEGRQRRFCHNFDPYPAKRSTNTFNIFIPGQTRRYLSPITRHKRRCPVGSRCFPSI